MVRRFNDGDLVLAKVAGSPPWPAVVRPCNVTDDDESFKFNGEYYRRPDWFWVLFFEDSVEPQSGIWVRSSKMRVLDYKANPVETENEPLVEAHKYAERYFETHRPDEVEQFKTSTKEKSGGVNAPNGQSALDSNDSEDADDSTLQKNESQNDNAESEDKETPDPGSTNQGAANSTQTPRRSSRARVKKASTTAIVAEKRTATERSPSSRSTKRRRGGGNAPAQKRPRRTSMAAPREMEEGDMEMTASELRQALWKLRRRNNELEEMIANVRNAIAPRRTK